MVWPVLKGAGPAHAPHDEREDHPVHSLFSPDLEQRASADILRQYGLGADAKKTHRGFQEEIREKNSDECSRCLHHGGCAEHRASSGSGLCDGECQHAVGTKHRLPRRDGDPGWVTCYDPWMHEFGELVRRQLRSGSRLGVWQLCAGELSIKPCLY
jgi:hypothetical protein